MTEKTAIPTGALLQSVVMLLTEAYDGPPDPSQTWFVDNERNSGILGILATVSAAEASRSVDGSGQNGSTIAANVEHLRWSLANVNATMRGEDYRNNWSESWILVGADEAEWDRLRHALRAEYQTLREAILRQEELDDVYLNGLLSLVPHAAFHLGIIRQMIERVRDGK
jgi:hypothetical protein